MYREYNFTEYVDHELWSSYFVQIKEILATKSNSLLEIGVGSGLPGYVLKNFLKHNYESLDINPDLNPDYIGSVLDMPFENKKYDTVCCFEVLEHLPFEDFEKALTEIFRIAKINVILSLPNASPVLKFHITRKIKIKIINLQFLFRPRKHKFNGVHYWEIDKIGFEAKKITKLIQMTAEKNSFSLLKYYRIWENPYHQIFILKRTMG